MSAESINETKLLRQVIDNLISIFLSLLASLWAEIICTSLCNVVNIRSKAVPLYNTSNCFMEAFPFSEPVIKYQPNLRKSI